MANAVTLTEVVKTYYAAQGNVHALGPISLSMASGETLAVVGPSGCGKSTLLRIVAGLDEGTGSVRVGERAVTAPVPDVGIVFQRDLLLDWRTVLGNVLLPAELQSKIDLASARRRAADLLGELGVADFANRYPWELSGGMRQRVAIARAMLCRPSMLLLDEPFSALDALTRDQMNVILQKVQMSEPVTTLMITHSIQEAVLLSDRVIVMSPRPGTVLDDIAVRFPRPRRLSLREEPGFIEIARGIRVQFERAGVLVE